MNQSKLTFSNSFIYTWNPIGTIFLYDKYHKLILGFSGYVGLHPTSVWKAYEPKIVFSG